MHYVHKILAPAELHLLNMGCGFRFGCPSPSLVLCWFGNAGAAYVVCQMAPLAGSGSCFVVSQVEYRGVCSGFLFWRGFLMPSAFSGFPTLVVTVIDWFVFWWVVCLPSLFGWRSWCDVALHTFV